MDYNNAGVENCVCPGTHPSPRPPRRHPPRIPTCGLTCAEGLLGTHNVRGFATMMRNLTGTRDLPQWIASVQTSDLNGLPTFANGIQRDLAGVTNGLSLSYSSGPSTSDANSQLTHRARVLARHTYA